MSSVKNQKQLNRLICEELISDRLFLTQSTNLHTLVVTGEDPCPNEIRVEERRICHDLENQQEEADTIIAQQVLMCAEEAQKADYDLSALGDMNEMLMGISHQHGTQ